MALTGVHLFHSLPLDRRSQQLFAIGMFVLGSLLSPSLTLVYFRASESSSSTSLSYLDAGIWVHLCRSLTFLFTALITFVAVSVL
ncbi:hypothetical protein BDZ97DRAFT_1855149 [Flammula alnicola]|nr:hypothetical protein BDZ97DRAFT_1855149 [Flammula alnicola]